MTIYKKQSHGKSHLYGRTEKGEEYIGPENDPTKWNRRVVTKILAKESKKIQDSLTHYIDDIQLLSLYMPEPERKEYLSKRSAELLARLRLLEEKVLTSRTQENNPEQFSNVLHVISTTGKNGATIPYITKHTNTPSISNELIQRMKKSKLIKIDKTNSRIVITERGKSFLLDYKKISPMIKEVLDDTSISSAGYMELKEFENSPEIFLYGNAAQDQLYKNPKNPAREVLIGSTIRKTLREINPNLPEEFDKILRIKHPPPGGYYTAESCYKHPEYLKEVLPDLVGDSYVKVIKQIKDQLQKSGLFEYGIITKSKS